MRELIPFIPEEEYKSISKELLGKDVSIIFDGTTRDEEALAMLIRYVHEWEVKIRDFNLIGALLIVTNLPG